MSLKSFDYIIIGAGASGLQLALAFLRDDFFKEKHIGIIEKKIEFKNDKTWCYWEEGAGLYDDIIYKSWNKGYFKSLGKHIDLDLKSYNYKMIKSIDFYNYAISEISNHENIHFIQDELEVIKEDIPVKVKCKKADYTAQHVFDSRLPENFKPSDSINILQHFKGLFIETEKDSFDDSRFCMMDYNHTKTPETAFVYVLPFSKTQALVEYTLFTPKTIEDKVYDHHIEKYIKEALNIDQYRIYDIEKGVIPMSTYPFHKDSQKNITKIGTSGGWVKASTGYSFKNAERLSRQIIKNIKSNLPPHHQLFKSRFQHYDKMFLEVLYFNNAYGKRLFFNMYSRNSIQDIFKFLDEKSSFIKELQIMASMTSSKFLKAFFKHAFQGFKIH